MIVDRQHPGAEENIRRTMQEAVSAVLGDGCMKWLVETDFRFLTVNVASGEALPIWNYRTLNELVEFIAREFIRRHKLGHGLSIALHATPEVEQKIQWLIEDIYKVAAEGSRPRPALRVVK